MTLKCSACGSDNRDGAAFCLGCGSRIEAARPPADPSASVTDATWASTASDVTVQSRTCGECGVANRASDNFCKACGAAIAPAGPATAVLPVMAPSSPTNRSKVPIIAFAVAACLVLAGAGFVLLTGTGGDDNEAPAAQEEGAAALEDEDRAEEESSTVSPSSVANEVERSGSVVTVPAQVVPTTTTTQPPAQTTLAPPPPATTAAPPTTLVPGDLGLALTMTRPPCDDTYITLLAASLDPATDATAVGDALARYPGSAYLKTIETCPSLRPSVDGAEIYVVYLGPFLTEAEACAARASGPSDAYVRILSLTVPDTHRINC